ncbi:YggT family protein [Craterilacuibacter sinensis]|uniref:YggT family protein n=1 Tax=Craterilacuibacter sinensis TaxID=2686017 RepID=A0A845BIF8_9NEIS|nr:YggT family protein [Craterilacuibacter sinensis]MXR35942.1 YggT family protein [Craterilacuibacter sinensis]RQW27069.1 YggT family protein [Rhodobacteraceae bacterium CH30]
MLINTLQFLIRTVADLFVLVLLLRFYLQVVRMPFTHPLAQFVMAATNFAVLPLRRLLPSVRGYDTATMFIAWLVGLVSISAVLLLGPMPFNFAAPQTWLGLALLSVLTLFTQSVYLLMGAVLVQAIMSWVNPYNPLAPMLSALTRPFLAPFSRARIGGADLSPLLLLLVLQVILMLPVRFLEQTFLQQLQLAF